jgi:uncharacterized repeat protein (TIGR03803 family)
MKTKIFIKPSIHTESAFETIRTIITTLFFLLLSLSSLRAQDVLMGLTSNGGPEGKGTAYSIKTDGKGFNVIKGFANWGESPVNSLVRGTDGYLYGMAHDGGTYGGGTIFKISTSGDITILKNFNLNVDGGYPKGSLIQANDGNFWGMASSGPNSGGGAVFKITPDGKYSIVRALSSADGTWPRGHLVQAADGHLYGITRTGGAFGSGTIFRLKLDGTFTVLKSLNGTTEGKECYGSLMQGSDGAFYGMTYWGGNYNHGVIFRFSTTTGYKVLKHLNGAIDAAYPTGDLVQKDDYLYGMAPTGVSYNGVIFKLKLDGSSFSKIHDMGTSGEGMDPAGSLVLAKDGFLYGITPYLSGGYGGAIFKMTSSGSVTTLKKLTPATDGNHSLGSLIQLPDGSFYGTTQYGGKYGFGTIFKLTGTTLTVLAHMNGYAQGNVPQDNLALGRDSAYFGVTQYGGTYNAGTIFKICGGVTTVLRSFNRNTEGGQPTGGLIRGKDGNLYGMTETGGTNGGGTIFRITPTGSFAVLRHLKGATDGQNPKGTLALNTIVATDSALYGMTNSGGTGSAGTIFKITQKGTFTVLRNLAYTTDGNDPQGGLVMGTDGIFYGLTSSKFFKIKPDGTSFAIVQTFNYSTIGSTPGSSLVRGTDGAFYGTMSSGGASTRGTIFKITTGGLITLLKTFNGTTEGGKPVGSLVRGSDGAFYGTTTIGGTGGVGTIFRISGTSFSVLKSFNMATDGGTPLGGLILAPKVTLVANGQTGLTTTEDVAKAITLTGSGATNITYNILIKPRHGSVNTGTTAARTYTPAANYYGVDSFAFTTNLGCLSSAPAWVKISVTGVNDAPVISNISNKTVVKGTALSFIIPASDADPNQTKTFSLISPPTGAAISSTGTFTWTPSATGTFTVKVRVTDNGSPVLYSEKTFTVTVTATAVTTSAVSANALTMSNQMEASANLKAALYPNPVVSSFTVNLKQQAQDVKLAIVDMKGAVVYSKQYNSAVQQLPVNASGFKSGSYIMMIQAHGITQALRFVKQ